jgi:hypothetical protein
MCDRARRCNIVNNKFAMEASTNQNCIIHTIMKTMRKIDSAANATIYTNMSASENSKTIRDRLHPSRAIPHTKSSLVLSIPYRTFELANFNYETCMGILERLKKSCPCKGSKNQIQHDDHFADHTAPHTSSLEGGSISLTEDRFL